MLKIIAGVALEGNTKLQAGIVVDVKQGLDVSCGNEKVYRITHIQPEGKKAMNAADYLRGASIQVGDVLS